MTYLISTIESVHNIADATLTLVGNDAAAMAILAMIFVVLVGAMLTPALLWAARKPLVRRLAMAAVWFGIRWLLWHAILWLLFPQPLG